MITINIATNLKAEFSYVCAILFGEFLGLEYELDFQEGLEFASIAFENKRITFQSDFWKNEDYLREDRLPKSIGFAEHELFPEGNLPVLFGTDELKISSEQINCGIDVFAGCFFLLTRWEELVCKKSDVDGRFPGLESLAHRFGFLERPVVDESVDFIWNMLQFLGYKGKRKVQEKKLFVSCDVDHPFDPSVRNFAIFFKTALADVMKRKSLKRAFQRTRLFFFNSFGNYRYDSCFTFDRYMGLCEKYKHRAVFHFISDSSEAKNGTYHIGDRRIGKILREINRRGHEIGLHGSYQSYLDPQKIKHEKDLLQNELKRLGINEEVRSTRQHYLRWNMQYTPEYLNEAGLETDSTGGYADLPGFRFGTAREFSMWGWISKTKLRIRQCPLIVMECTYLDEEFLNLPVSDELKFRMGKLKETALKYGNFSLLWHNNRFLTDKEYEIFEYLLSGKL